MTSEPKVELLLATVNVDKALLRVLLATATVHDRRQNQAAVASRKLLQALELSVCVHRRDACTSAQLQEMERIAAEIEELAK